MLVEFMIVFTLIFIIIFLIGILVSYFWAKSQNSIYPKKLKNIEDYTFFFQTIIDDNGNLSGLEALLRKIDEKKQEWVFPKDIDSFTLREVVYLLHNSLVNSNHSSSFLAINISLRQLSDPRYEYFIRWLKGECYPMDIRMEFNIELDDKISLAKKLRIKNNLIISQNLGVHVILEKIKPEKSYYRKVKWVLKNIYGIKIPLSKFKKKTSKEWFELNIGDWIRLAQKQNKKIDITEIEKNEDLNLATKLDINNRQGYWIDRPHYEI
ncbi:EAL domain-containing protein [Lactococcus lactis]|uniref:EAL domain-containing protein n=1 Tax=Lactococcus lactis TaxID=1358 RepID=UPI003877C21D